MLICTLGRVWPNIKDWGGSNIKLEESGSHVSLNVCGCGDPEFTQTNTLHCQYILINIVCTPGPWKKKNNREQP